MTGKKNLLRVLFTIIITLTAIINLHPYVNCNGAGGGYDDGGDKAMVQGNSIEALIAQSAWYYLKANAEIQEFLAMVEGQDIYGINIQELRVRMENAALHMANAHKTYESLIKTAEVTPYNAAVIAKLATFDYDRFILEQGLDSPIYREVQGYLQEGDITGVFKRVLASITGMTVLLAAIKTELDQEQIPSLAMCRLLNENLAGTSLFGSFVARIFADLE